MSGETKVQCPICGRLVGFVPGATNLAGELVMARHWRADVLRWEQCAGSSRSPRAAAPAPAADYDGAVAAELRALRAQGNAERRAQRAAKRRRPA